MGIIAKLKEKKDELINRAIQFKVDRNLKQKEEIQQLKAKNEELNAMQKQKDEYNRLKAENAKLENPKLAAIKERVKSGAKTLGKNKSKSPTFSSFMGSSGGARNPFISKTKTSNPFRGGRNPKNPFT